MGSLYSFTSSPRQVRDFPRVRKGTYSSYTSSDRFLATGQTAAARSSMKRLAHVRPVPRLHRRLHREAQPLTRQLPIFVDMPDRRARITRLIEQRGEVVGRLGEVRVELERLAIELDRLALAAGVLREDPEVVERRRIRGVEVERALEAITRRLGIARLREQPAEVDPGLC